ncbi:MAG: hypothetical protein ACLVH7_05310 [Flavonifractor plautii]|jgi:hypothetical protein
MARAIEKGQHIFIAFQGGKAVMDSQLRPRMYKSREQFEKSFPAWRDGKAELVEYAPTLTPPNEPLTLEDAKKERYIWFTPLNDWAKVTPFGVLFFGSEELMNWETLCEEWGYRFKAYRRPPEVSP